MRRIERFQLINSKSELFRQPITFLNSCFRFDSREQIRLVEKRKILKFTMVLCPLNCFTDTDSISLILQYFGPGLRKKGVRSHSLATSKLGKVCNKSHAYRYISLFKS